MLWHDRTCMYLLDFFFFFFPKLDLLLLFHTFIGTDSWAFIWSVPMLLTAVGMQHTFVNCLNN